ncbi:MAG TPA: sugar transferase [Caldilineae bacterium]|nr:sugar transferase [Caldilineae bacterium]
MAERLLKFQRPLMALLDLVLVVAAFFLAWYIRYELQWYRSVDPASYTGFGFYLEIGLLAGVFMVAALSLEGAYKLPRGASFLNEFYRLVTATSIVTIILMMGNYMFQPAYHSRLVYGIAGLLILLFLTISRIANRQLMARLRRRGIGIRRVLLVGAGEVSRMIMRVLLAKPDLGFEVMGFLDDNPAKGKKNLGPFSALGSIDNLAQVIDQYRVEEVIITLPWQYHRRIMSVLNQCTHLNVRARVVPDVLQLSLDQVDVEVLDGIPLLGVKTVSISGSRLAIKRTLDVLITLVGMIVILPVMALVALAIKLDTPGPVLFVQKRIGKNGQPFNAFKFRSMVADAEDLRGDLTDFNEADGPLFKIKNDPRLTRTGRWIRRFSLDELPQVFNVLRGEMSLVGPRPALPEEVDAYESWHRKRLEVTPGLTGMWQVSGRSNLSFDEMVMLDIYYVENWSPFLDLSIMLRTIPKVLSGEGAY